MRRPNDEIERFLPLKPVVYHILLAISQEALHGYGIIQAVRDQSEGRIVLQTGTLYRHLRRLLDDGFVEEGLAGRKGDDPRRGSYYHITRHGRDVMRAEWQRMSALVEATRDMR